MKFLSLISLFALLSSRLLAQSANEKFENELMEEKGGAKIIYSSASQSFTLDVISNKIQPQQAGYLSVDNKILQYVFIRNEALKQNEITEEQQRAQLLAYMNYELDYIKNDLKLKYTNLVSDWVVINGKIYLSWYYDMPENKKAEKGAILKQCNLSTLCFAHVLNLNTPFEKDDNIETDKAFLSKVAKTLKMNDFKIDFADLYKQLQREMKD